MKEIRKLDVKQLTNIAKTVKNSLLKEDNDRFTGYRASVELDFDRYNDFEGKDIEDFRFPREIEVTYDLYIYERRWGIESIGIVNIKGPKEIEVEFDIFNEEKDDYDTFYHTIKLNWDEKYLESETSSSDYNCIDIQTRLYKIEISLDKALFQEKITYYPFED